MERQFKVRTAPAATVWCLLTVPVAAAASSGGTPPVSPLFAAIRSGNYAQVRFLAAKRSDVNVADAAGETPLMYAALYGDAKPVTLLLTRGAAVNARSAAGTTALMLAVADVAKVRSL